MWWLMGAMAGWFFQSVWANQPIVNRVDHEHPASRRRVPHDTAAPDHQIIRDSC